MNHQADQVSVAVPEMNDPRSRAERERSAIIRAAHRLIGSGTGGVTPIEDILRDARVNRRTFYRHFSSKDALLLAMQHEAGELVRAALWSAADRAADGRAAVLAWIEEFLSIGWDTRRLREGRTFLAPEAGLVAGLAAAMEDIHARHRAVLEATLRRALTDGTLPAAAPERDAFAIHAVALRCLEMRARGRLDRSYQAARDEIAWLVLPVSTTRRPPPSSPPPTSRPRTG
jgi:AcrR family transcriptional regulator